MAPSINSDPTVLVQKLVLSEKENAKLSNKSLNNQKLRSWMIFLKYSNLLSRSDIYIVN